MKSLKINPEKTVKYSLIALGIFCVVYIILYLWFGIKVLASPYQYDYGEGFHWYLSNMIANGHNVYHGVNVEPYVTMVYTPVYYLVSALGIKIFGSYLVIGRLVSFIATILSCVLISGIVWKVTGKKIAGIVSGILPLTIGFFGYWSVMFRVDALALFFTLIGLFIVVCNLDNKKILWSVPFFLLAIFTKQSYIIAPVSVIIFLFFKDRGMCLRESILLFIGGISLVGICTLVFGNSFIQQTFLVGSQPHNWHLGWNLIKLVLYSLPAILAFSLSYLICKLRDRKLDLFSIYFILSACMCILLITKEGAWLNYAMEFVVASSILVGLLLGRLINKNTPKLFVEILLIAVLIILPLSPLGSWYNYKLPKDISVSYDKIQPILENSSNPVICEDATLAMRSGKSLVWEPSVFVLGGYYRTTWNQTPFVTQIKDKKFSAIVLNYNLSTWWLPQDSLPYPKPYERLTEEMATAIRDNYYLEYNSKTYWLYLPK